MILVCPRHEAEGKSILGPIAFNLDQGGSRSKLRFSLVGVFAVAGLPRLTRRTVQWPETSKTCLEGPSEHTPDLHYGAPAAAAAFTELRLA